MCRRSFVLLLIFFFLSLTSSCNQGSCSTEEQEKGLCENSFIDKDNVTGQPTAAEPLESEPNDYYFQANVLSQTKEADGSFDYKDDSFSRIGTFDNEVDEDWYAISLTAEDFDRMKADSPGCTTNSLADFQRCYSQNGSKPKPRPNDISDYKETTVQTGYTQAKFYKARFIVQLTSPDLEEISARVEVFPPGLTINYSGALTQKSIADSYHHSIENLTPLDNGGPLRKIATAGLGALRVPFPILWEHTVRVDNRDLNNTFYHNCAVQSVVNNPNPVKEKKSLEYQYMVEGNVNGFRAADTFNVGIYYVRVRSNGNFTGRRYRIKWYWNTFNSLEGGMSEHGLKGGSTTTKAFKLAYDDKVQQTDGASGGTFTPATCASQDGASAPWYTSTDPYCLRPLFIADILCNDSTRQQADVYCYNTRNQKVNTAASTNILDLCVGDGNQDGVISATSADVLCAMDTSPCDSRQGYKESERACDCWKNCSYPGGAPPGCL